MTKNVEIELIKQFDKDKTVYTIRRDTLNSNKMVCGPFFIFIFLQTNLISLFTLK